MEDEEEVLVKEELVQEDPEEKCKAQNVTLLVHWYELFHQHELWKILVIIYRYATIISNTTLYCSNAHVWYIRDCLVKQEKETNIPRQRMKKQDWTNDM